MSERECEWASARVKDQRDAFLLCTHNNTAVRVKLVLDEPAAHQVNGCWRDVFCTQQQYYIIIIHKPLFPFFFSFLFVAPVYMNHIYLE